MNSEAVSGNTVTCDYCGNAARLVTGGVIYPHRSDLNQKHFYQCKPCGAHVGCHPGTTAALGRLADAELRRAKSAAHAAFDPLWQAKGRRLTRSAAYAWLARELGIKPADCHIGMFDVATCNRVVAICQKAEAA